MNMGKTLDNENYDDEEYFRQYNKKPMPWWIWFVVVAIPIIFIVTIVNSLETRHSSKTLKSLREEFASYKEKVDSLDNSVTELWKLVPSTPTTPSTSVEKYTTVNLNLRKGAGSTFEKIALMPRGSKVVVLEEGLEWLKVRYTDQDGKVYEGYANKQFLSDKP
ncbi:MAG: hypothetical protein DDT22_01006 [candidate division WS2 bacterium]|nr:hypothetical protein [Candidatus Lithacetigena glycinireducens]